MQLKSIQVASKGNSGHLKTLSSAANFTLTHVRLSLKSTFCKGFVTCTAAGQMVVACKWCVYGDWVFIWLHSIVPTTRHDMYVNKQQSHTQISLFAPKDVNVLSIQAHFSYTYMLLNRADVLP